jgi:glutamate racemase
MKIGVFDSGLGGLTVVQRLREQLPQAEIVFFSDRANVPYGDRSAEELHGILTHNIRLLEQCGVDAIVMGCNTSCAIAAQFGWPDTRVPIFDLIEAGANQVFAACHFSAGVVATNATVRAQAYSRAIQRRHELITVEEVAVPELVPLIERAASRAELVSCISAALARFTQSPTALIFGCSHYALVADIFRECAPAVALIDPAVGQADTVAAYARAEGLSLTGKGSLHAWTNADPIAFERAVAALGLHLPDMQFGPPATLSRVSAALRST